MDGGRGSWNCERKQEHLQKGGGENKLFSRFEKVNVKMYPSSRSSTLTSLSHKLSSRQLPDESLHLQVEQPPVQLSQGQLQVMGQGIHRERFISE